LTPNMKKSNYTLLVLVALTIINIFSDFLVEFIAGVFGDDVKNNVSKQTLLIIFAVFILLTLALIIFQYFHEKNSADSSANNLTDNIEPNIKLLFDSLTERYKKRYESKLDGRFEITLEVNKEPFSVNYQTNKNIDEAFKAINESFNQKGRLLIVGSPGSGKTVLLLKLAIELLGEDCKVDQRLPVIFNLASWSPVYAKFDDWLIDVLNAGNGLSKDFARTLLEQNHIIFLLDGLDELARNEGVVIANRKRAKCLDSLNDYLRMGRKVVICCRREEFAEMQMATNQDAPVSAKVEVLDLSKAEIVLALQHAQQDTKSNASATNLLKIIETNDVFLDVLATPFYFTTALEVFDSEILKEKDFPTDGDAIKKYLLDKFIDSKLKLANELTEFEKDKAKILKWLKILAQSMEVRGTVTFELADLQPSSWSKSRTFPFVIFLMSLLLIYLNSLFFSFSFGLILGFIVGVCCYFFAFSFNYGDLTNYDLAEIELERGSSYHRRIAYTMLMLIFGLIYGLFFGFLTGLFADFVFGIDFSYVFNIILRMFIVVTAFLIASRWLRVLTIMETDIIVDQKNSYQRILGRIFRNLYLILLLLILGFILDKFNDFITNPVLNFLLSLIKIIFILTPILLIFSLLQHFILRLCLWFEGSTPLKYATFLNLAAEARILEKDGGHWRFRHQTLQEHFAKSGNDLSAE
jgi:NACHT domain